MIDESSSAPLSEEQLARFDCDGYVVVEGVLAPSDLQPVIEEITTVIDRRAKVHDRSDATSFTGL